MIHRLINIFIHRYKQLKAKKQLKWQEFLFRNGVGFRTRLLDIVEEGRPINDYVLLCIRARLRVKGKIVCRRMHTVLKCDRVPHAGEIVHIRYKPRHLNNVLLLEAGYQ